MWVPKTPDENETCLRREAMSCASVFTGVFLVLTILAIKTGWQKLTTTFAPVAWSEVLSQLHLLLGASAACFVGTYFFQKTRYRRMRSQVFVCLQCGKDDIDLEAHTCQCGGQVVDLNRAKWLDPEAARDVNAVGPRCRNGEGDGDMSQGK